MKVAVAIITWAKTPERIGYLRRTLDALRYRLAGFDDNCSAIVCPETFHTLDWDQFALAANCSTRGAEIVYHDDAPSIGGNFNHALRTCRSFDYVLLMQDDWLLTEPLDLAGPIRFLRNNPDFAMVRFGWSPHAGHTWPGAKLQEGNPAIYEVDPASIYLYADEPHLRRGNSLETIGHYDEGGNMGTAELSLNRRLKERGTRVAITDRRFFEHCGSESCCPDHFTITSPVVAP